MTRRGRPLRFLVLVCTGWIGLRVALLWHATGSLTQAIETMVPFALNAAPPAAPPNGAPAFPVAVAAAFRPTASPPLRPVAAVARHYRDPYDARKAQLAMVALIRYGDPEYAGGPRQAAPVRIADPGTPPSLGWSGALWVLGRRSGSHAAAPGAAQLGGGQAGIRIAYGTGPRGALAFAGRLTSPLEGPGREASVAIEWQPTRLPVRLVVERRVSLDGGKGGPGAGLVAGVYSQIPSGFRIEAYGQAGVVMREQAEPYADGAARILRPVRERRGASVALGAGSWGGAQRGVSRLDIGPAAVLDFPAGETHMRLAVEWRQRVAGNALPGSGLAVTLGADF
ncbi:hypothetical protein [Sphingosinithalassobacter portus]|uniref:hypothetical protein n=1 Tax=Stakelama portus TaxID=2676234 RepID=UPI000D6DD0BA|nr:hypothetical protein [Sphingosinithalassobacter portus]